MFPQATGEIQYGTEVALNTESRAVNNVPNFE